MGCIITGAKRHMKGNPISAEDYLRNEVWRANQPQKADRFNECVDHFAQLQKYKHTNIAEMGENDMVTKSHTNIPHVMQTPRCAHVENTESGKQNGNWTKSTHEHSKWTTAKLLPIQDWKG